ncbi:MAG TPA: hypothetical protein VL027_12565 [Spongiibacteraceae bacterium]|nr:hypothetical protein [Spongiibacteraceae bacterium]
MTKIEYLKRAPGAKPGAIRVVDSRTARALVGLGYARYFEARGVPPEPVSPAPEPDIAEKPKRQYRRRDLQAEKP